MNRREFIKLAAVGGVAGLLAACGIEFKTTEIYPNDIAVEKLANEMGISPEMTDKQIAEKLQVLADNGWGRNVDLGAFLVNSIGTDGQGNPTNFLTGPNGELEAIGSITLPEINIFSGTYKIGDRQGFLTVYLPQGVDLSFLPPGLSEKETENQESFNRAQSSQLGGTWLGWFFDQMGQVVDPETNLMLELSFIPVCREYSPSNQPPFLRTIVRKDKDPKQPLILSLPLGFHTAFVGIKNITFENILKSNLWALTQAWARLRMKPPLSIEDPNFFQEFFYKNYGPATALGLLTMADRRFEKPNKSVTTWQERILGEQGEQFAAQLIEPVVASLQAVFPQRDRSKDQQG